MGLWYSKDTDMSLTAYADANHAGCQDTRRSTSGSTQFLDDKLVRWSSKKQKSTAISSTKAEYIALFGFQHSRAKHIDIRYYFIKEQVENGIVELYFVRTEYQLADIFTKPLPRERFNFFIDKLVVLDALALTPCYPAFIITADVPEVYMHQFWNCVYKHDNFYRFKIDKKKRFKLTLEVFRDILQICPRVQGRDFDALPSEKDTLSFLRYLGHTGVINSLNDVVIDQMHQPWRNFAAIINRSLSRKTSGFDKLCLSRAHILWGMYHEKYVDYVELLWEDFTYQIDNKVYKKQENINKTGMHTSKDDYLINTLRFVSRKEASQIYGAVIPECLTSPEMKESKGYKTYLGHATCVVPPKIARKFKKASPTKKDSIVIREPLVETKSKGKEKEKVDVARGKEIELLSEVALTEKAQLKEVRKKSLRDFHKTHPSGSGTGAEKPPSVENITPTVTSEGTSDKPGVPDVTEDNSTESESESWGSDEDDNNNKQESSNEGSEQENEKEEEVDQENESKDDEIKSDEDKGMDDTTDQFDDDDVHARLEEPTQTGKEFV
ncbi:hypothetical protein Tco_0193859 [Tanacetum coccineum]